MESTASSSTSPPTHSHEGEGSVSPFRTLLSTLGVLVFAVPGTLLMAGLAIVTSWIPPAGAGVLFSARIWSRCLLAAGGVKVELDAHEDFDPDRSYVFLPNHQSYFDIPALFATVPSRLRFAAKANLFAIPVFGWSLKAGGFIPIDRNNLAGARSAFSSAGERLEEGISLVFFPEGTRSFDGTMGAFQRGGFLLALKSGLPIVPVGISGAFRVMSRRSIKVSPGTIRLRLGRPIDPADYGLKGKRQLVADVREKVAELAGFSESSHATLPSSKTGDAGTSEAGNPVASQEGRIDDNRG